jgi:hypothetical protein
MLDPAPRKTFGTAPSLPSWALSAFDIIVGAGISSLCERIRND